MSKPLLLSRLFEFLLRAQLVGVPAPFLAAVDRALRQARVARPVPADHLVAVVFARQRSQGGIHDSTAQSQDEMERRLLLDVVVGEGAAVLELLTSENETLLVGRNTLLVLDLCFHVLDGVGALDIQGNGFTRKCLHEDLHFEEFDFVYVSFYKLK